MMSRRHLATQREQAECDANPTTLDVVRMYAATLSSSSLLDVNSQSAVGDTVYHTVPMRMDHLPEMAEFMYTHGRSVFIEYENRTGKVGWFLVVRRTAMDEPIHTQTALFTMAIQVTKRGESVVALLPPGTMSINMTWTRDVSFCRLAMREDRSLMCTVPARLMTASKPAGEMDRSFTPDLPEPPVRAHWCTVLFKYFAVAVFVGGVVAIIYTTWFM